MRISGKYSKIVLATRLYDEGNKEGQLSDAFENVYAPFVKRVNGTSLENGPQIVVNDGIHTRATFED